MEDLDALVLLLDRYLSWARSPDDRGLAEAVAAFEVEQGEPAVREARDAIRWLQGGSLDVDSLDLLELLMEAEEREGFTISDQDAASLPELLQRLRRLLDEDDEDDGGSSVREPRPPRPTGPPPDGAAAEPA